MAYVDLESDDGAWAGYITDAKALGRLSLLDNKDLQIANNKDLQIALLEKKLQKAEKYIAKLEAANRRLSELIADN